MKEILTELVLEACERASEIRVYEAYDSYAGDGTVEFDVPPRAVVNFSVLAEALDLSSVSFDVPGAGYGEERVHMEIAIREDFNPEL